MTRGEAQQLQHGLYIVHWHGGGCSLAAVGSNARGQRWLAPTNWITGVTNTQDTWGRVREVELLALSSSYNRRNTNSPNHRFILFMHYLRKAAGVLLWAIALAALVISIKT